jgi:leader peptidase (prepilin peptidase) / N-methyltransferase
MNTIEHLPAWLLGAYAGVLGALTGSFLNVVIARLPEGMSVVRPRSRCPQCESLISWFDNIPVLSWLILQGRCRTCKKAIALRYPLVEFLTSCVFLSFYLRYGLSFNLLLWLPLSAALLAITFLDIDHFWIPDVITFPAMLYVFALTWIPGGLAPSESLLGLLPTLLLWGVGAIFKQFTGREGMGFGDIKLLAVVGLAMGLLPGLLVLVWSSIQGSLIGLLLKCTGGHVSADEINSNQEPPQDKATEHHASAPEQKEATPSDAQIDHWVPPAGAFPFGPFIVLATLEVALLPEYFAQIFVLFP